MGGAKSAKRSFDFFYFDAKLRFALLALLRLKSNYKNLVIFPARVKNFDPFSCKKLALLGFRGSESPERVKMSLIIVKF